MPAVLRALSRGSVFQKIFAIFLRVVGVLFGLSFLVGWVLFWGIIAKLPAVLVPLMLLVQLIGLVGAYMVIHTLFIRANDIARLGPSEFPVTFIMTILTRLLGDLWAIICSVGGLSLGLLLYSVGAYGIYLSDEDVVRILLLGIGGLIGGVVVGFMGLVFFYWLAETEVVLVMIARNTGWLRRMVPGEKT